MKGSEKVKKRQYDAMLENDFCFMEFYSRLHLLATNLFKWENLPDTMNENFLEETLYQYGKACFVYDKNIGYLNLRALSYNQNIYGEGLYYVCEGKTGYNETFKAEEITFIKNNSLCTPTYRTMWFYAEKIFKAERTIDINLHAHKTPLLIKCDKETKTSYEIAYNQYDGNKPFIIVDKTTMGQPFDVVVPNAPYLIDKLSVYQRNLWNSALTFLGINNANIDKKERQITDEVNANNEIISVFSDIMLYERQKACADFNKKFNQNISVKRRCENERIHNTGAETVTK
jgi:hypothetical protein